MLLSSLDPKQSCGSNTLVAQTKSKSYQNQARFWFSSTFGYSYDTSDTVEMSKTVVETPNNNHKNK